MKKTVSDKNYFEYLQQRSTLGALYRNWLLYPKLRNALQGNVLDFGCGIGDFLSFREDSVGVDINQHNVEFCRSLGLDAGLIQDGRTPFKDSSFGSVVMDNVLEHIPEADVDAVLNEVLRVLQPSGRLLIGVPGLKGYAADDDHKCFYSEQDLVELLGRYGCKMLRSFHMPVYFPWLDKHLSQYCVYVLFEK